MDRGQQNQQEPAYFVGKRVVITGASSGLGESLSYWYLNAGAQVALVGRDIKRLQEIGKEFPHQALVIQCDLAIDLQQYEMAIAVIEKLGGIDIVINCAGLIFDGDLESTFPQDYDYLVDINLRCSFHLTLLFQRYLEVSRGCLVNVSSVMGNRPMAGVIGYSMTKAGLEMMTKCLALELAPAGVRINCVVPGTMDTNLYRYSGMSQSEHSSYMKRAANNNPLQRIANVDEIAQAIVFLTSEKAIRITGHIMKVDGGRTLTSSGWMPWYGKEIMNRRFEPDFFSKVNYWFSMKKKKQGSYPKAGTDPSKVSDWVASTQTSNWATHSEDAHFKVLQDYKKEEMDEDEINHYVNQQKEGGAAKPTQAKRK